MSEQPIVSIQHLKTYFDVTRGMFAKKQIVKAVDDVSFDVYPGETFGLVGESGCGKSTLGRTIVKIYDPTGGKIFVKGKDITELKGKDLHEFRRTCQLIFQDPYASLDPRMTVGEIIKEPMQINHLYGTAKEQEEKAEELLKLVGLKPDHIRRYPHEFSGGQRQRISIARAHDLAMVEHISDRIGVMYLGHLVEIGEAREVYHHPLHPYSQALLSAVPIPDPIKGKNSHRQILQGEIPSPINPPVCCPFCTRCPFAEERCHHEMPAMKDYGGHSAACFKLEKEHE